MIAKSEILFIYNSVDYFKFEISKRDYFIANLYRDEKFLSRVLRKFFRGISVSEKILYTNWKSRVPFAKLIIVFAPVDISVLKFIKSKNPNVRIIYWYWNQVFRIGRPTKELYDLAEIWVYDKFDAVNYKAHFNNTFYFDSIKISSKPEVYEMLFVGKTKMREKKIERISDFLRKQGKRTFLHLLPTTNEKNPLQIKPIPYSEYLELIAESRAILDVMPPDQFGLTVRVMESIFLNKKLITDNKHIVDEPFYNPNNIFLIEGDHFEEALLAFLDKPYENVPESVKAIYDFDQWIQRIVQDRAFTY